MTPAERGYSMPFEGAPHAGCWLAWPQRAELWAGRIEEAREDYARVAAAIVDFEPVTMVAAPAEAADARRRLDPRVRVLALPIDDSWLRDSGPTRVLGPRGERAAISFRFNAWGGKFQGYERDAAVAGEIAAATGDPLFRSSLSCEGGGFYSDGEGTLVTADTCVLNDNRNPGVSRAEAEAELRAMLGMEKVIWLPGDPTETGTDGHVDGYVAFIRPGALLFETVADPADPRYRVMAENRRMLELETDARGRRFELVPIAEAPRRIVPDGEEGYCRSYVNFYLANGAVIVPSYGIAEDDEVNATLARAYPDRRVVPVALETLFRGGGGIHCITQQEPARSAAV